MPAKAVRCQHPDRLTFRQAGRIRPTPAKCRVIPSLFDALPAAGLSDNAIGAPRLERPPIVLSGGIMSAPSTVSNAQTTALQGLHQRSAVGRSQDKTTAPSQNQISFANLVNSLQGSATGTTAASSAASTVPSTSAAGATSSAGSGSDLASLLEALLSGNAVGAASSASQILTQPQTDTKSEHAHHHQHGGSAAQVNSGVNDAGSSAASAYSTMTGAGSQAAPGAGLSTHV